MTTVSTALVTATPPALTGARILYPMLRVSDLERSLRLYADALGMRLLRREDYPTGRFTLAFIGYTHESKGTVLELIHNWDSQPPRPGHAAECGAGRAIDGSDREFGQPNRSIGPSAGCVPA